jgi:hypothetical protein
LRVDIFYLFVYYFGLVSPQSLHVGTELPVKIAEFHIAGVVNLQSADTYSANLSAANPPTPPNPAIAIFELHIFSCSDSVKSPILRLNISL